MIGWFNRWPIWRGVTRVGSFRMYGDTFDRRLYLWSHARARSGQTEQQLLAAFVQPGQTAVDAGANIGLYTGLLAQAVGPAGRVLSFEPVPRLMHCLERNVRENGWKQVELHHAALGAETGDLAMTGSSYNSGDFRISREGLGERVRVCRGDDVIGDRTVDFIKIDVQGYELPALMGMEKSMLRSPNLTLFFEYWPAGMRRAGLEARAFRSWMSERNFKVFALGPGLRLESIGWEELDKFCIWRPWGAVQNFVATRSA